MEAKEEEGVSAQRRWKDDVEQAEEEFGQLFQEFLILKEEEYLQLHKTKFTSADIPRVGDLIHLRSMPHYLHFSLGIVFAVEQSDDGESRTYWVRVVKPKSSQHPSPHDQVTQEAEIYRRCVTDLCLLMRAEELGDDFTGNLFDEKHENDEEKLDAHNEDVEKKGDSAPKNKGKLGKKSKNVTFSDFLEHVDAKDDNGVDVGGDKPDSSLISDMENDANSDDNLSVATDPWSDSFHSSGEVDDEEDPPTEPWDDEFDKPLEDVEEEEDSDHAVLEEDNDHVEQVENPVGEKAPTDTIAEEVDDTDTIGEEVDDEEDSPTTPEFGRGRRQRKPRGFYANMAFKLIFMLAVFNPAPAYGYDFKRSDRTFKDICPTADLNYVTAALAAKDAVKTRDAWSRSLELMVDPSQIGLFQGLPLIDLRTPTTFTLGIAECARQKGRTVEFDTRDEYEKIKEAAVAEGYSCLVSHVRLDTNDRPIWSSGDIFNFSPLDLNGLIRRMQDDDYIGMLLWDLPTGNIRVGADEKVDGSCAFYCHHLDQPLYQSIRAFFIIARTGITALKTLDPSLEVLAKEMSEKYQDSHGDNCAPVLIELISHSTRSYVSVQPKEYVASTSQLENQYSRFSTFQSRYKDLQRELSTSLAIWSEHKDLQLDLFFSGTFKYLMIDNIGYNYMTLLLFLASIPIGIVLSYGVYKLYFHTLRRGSCLRHWSSRLSKKVLRKGRKRNKKMKIQRAFDDDEGGIEMRRNNEEDLDPEEETVRALVPYRRREHSRPVRNFPAIT